MPGQGCQRGVSEPGGPGLNTVRVGKKVDGSSKRAVEALDGLREIEQLK